MQRTAKLNLYLCLNRDHYAEEGETKFYTNIQSWRPSEDSDDIILREWEIEESVYLTEDAATVTQLNKYDAKDEYEKKASGLRIAQTDELRKSLLALPHLPPEPVPDMTTAEIKAVVDLTE